MIHLFFFSDTATTHIYTLSLHDALPISAITQPHAITLAAANDRDLKRRISSAARVAGNGRRGARAWGGPQRGERPGQDDRRSGRNQATTDHLEQLQRFGVSGGAGAR